MTDKNCLRSLLDQFHVRLRRRDTRLGLLLKRMQYVYCIANRHRVDRTKGVSLVVLHQFVYP